MLSKRMLDVYRLQHPEHIAAVIDVDAAGAGRPLSDSKVQNSKRTLRYVNVWHSRQARLSQSVASR